MGGSIFRSVVFGRHFVGTAPGGGGGGSFVAVSDTFTDSNGTLVSAHAPNAGNAWTSPTGDFLIFSNAVYPSSTDFDHISVIETNGADVTIAADILVSAGSRFAGGICFRYVDTSNYWVARIQRDGSAPARLTILEVNAGTQTERASYNDEAMVLTTQAVSVVLSGSSIIVKQSGVTRCTYSSSLHATATKHGLECYYTSGAFPYDRHAFDNFEVTL